MKNTKLTKICLVALSLVLVLAAAVGISVSAESEAPVIASKNVSYEGAVHLYYAIPVTENVKASNTVVNVYSSNPETDANAELIGSYKGNEGYINVLGGNYITIRTNGIPAKDIAKYVYAQPVSGGVKGDVVRYSVAEYLYERLYVSENSTALQKKLYNTTLQYGIDAQAVLDASATPIANYKYVYAYDATVDAEGNNSGLYLAGDKVTLSYTGEGKLEKWNLNTLGADGAFVAGTLTDNVLTVSATTKISASVFEVYTPVEKGELFNDAFADSEKENVRLTDITNAKYNSKIYANKGSTQSYPDVKFGVVADPVNANNKVIRLSKDNDNKDYANASAFNTNLYVKSTDKVTDFDLIIFDADLYFDYFDNSPSILYSLKLENGDWDSATTGVELNLGSNGTNMTANLRGNGISTEYTPVEGVAIEEAWFNLRVEYYIIDKDTNATNTKVYVNGKLIKDETYTASATPLYTINTAQFVSDSKAYGDFYMDNVVFERTSVAYEAELARPAYTFDGNTLPEGVTTSGWGSGTKGTTAIENGQLILNSTHGYNDSINFNETEAAAENANTVVLSMDISSTAIAAHASGSYTELQFKDVNGKMFRILAMLGDKVGASIWFSTYTYNQAAQVGGTNVKNGSVFNLRLEYYVNESTGIANVDIYVNGVYCGTTYDVNEPVLNVSDINNFTFCCREGDTQEVTFDNVKLYKINKTR